MANRRADQIRSRGNFEPQGLLPDGLLPIAYPTGEARQEVASATASLANTLNRFADEAAMLEGERAGRVAGGDKSFRPTGSTTLRGRAFDAAGIASYKDTLDASLRTDMQRVFEANKDNPAALKAGFDALQREYEGEHVFDEIKPAFRAGFARLRLPYENKALTNQDSDARDRNRGALITNIQQSQDNAARMAAADPNSPEAARVVQGEIARTERLYDEAVEGKIIDPATAARLKQSARDSIATRAALAQAETLTTPDEVAEYRKRARAKFAKGEFKGLSAEGFDDLDAKLEAIQRSKTTDANRAEILLQKNVNDFVQRVTEGFPVNQSEWTGYSAGAGAQTPKGKAILELGQKKLQVASVLRNRSVQEGEEIVAGLRAELARDGGANEAQAEIVRYAEGFVAEQRKALNTDQLKLAARKGVIAAVEPVDFEGFAQAQDVAGAAAGLAAQFRARTAQAKAVGQAFERAPQYLTQEEKARLKDIVDQGGDRALALAGAIVKGADADAPTILREISSDAPLLAQAGVIIANGGSLQAARDAFKAAEIARETKKPLPGLELTRAQPATRDTIGTALLMQPDDRQRIIGAADQIARTRMAIGNVDPKSGEADTIYKRALQEAAGAVFHDGVQYGGFGDYKPGWWTSYKVLVPAGVRADGFRDVIRSIRDEDFAKLAVPPVAASGAPYRARDFADAVPIAVRGGYRFALGDPNSADPKYIRGADGKPFVLPFQALEPTLRTRVPGAFLGGRR